MKKFWIIIVLALITLSGFSQVDPGSSYLKRAGLLHGSFNTPSGSDTSIYIGPFFSNEGWGLQIDYSNADAADATLDVGACPPDSLDYEVPHTTFFNSYGTLSSTSLPVTLSGSYFSAEKTKSNFLYLVLKYTKNSVSAGLEIEYWITYEKADRR